MQWGQAVGVFPAVDISALFDQPGGQVQVAADHRLVQGSAADIVWGIDQGRIFGRKFFDLGQIPIERGVMNLWRPPPVTT